MLKRTIPGTYIGLAILFLSLSVFLGIRFYAGICGDGYIIGPWTHLLMLVSAVGLSTTVFTGIAEHLRSKTKNTEATKEM